MNYKTLTVKSSDYPERLLNIDRKPIRLFTAGASLRELLKRPAVAIVGTRNITPYGEVVTANFTRQLAEQGIVIVSGLAIGVDALAHQSALAAGGLCIAVLPSPLDNILPATNRRLAQRILDAGGTLVSEYESGEKPFINNFIVRNRLMSGLADAVLVTEAGETSGAHHTATFGNKQGREVMAVPGSIMNSQSVGTNNLLKRGHAHVVTSYKDVLNILDIKDHATPAREVRGRNAQEQSLLDLMLQGITAGDILLDHSGLTAIEFAQTLTMLEIGGKIRPLGANHWAIS